jgi:ATP-dependent Lhr-like helicase
LREEFAGVLALGPAPIVVEGGTARWWTFAGARVNFALAAAIGYLRGWSATAENWLVKVQGPDITAEAMGAVIAQMRAEGFWDDPAVYRQLLERLPQFRLSKFQQVLPDAAVREMVGGALVDIGRVRSFLVTLA